MDRRCRAKARSDARLRHGGGHGAGPGAVAHATAWGQGQAMQACVLAARGHAACIRPAPTWSSHSLHRQPAGGAAPRQRSRRRRRPDCAAAPCWRLRPAVPTPQTWRCSQTAHRPAYSRERPAKASTSAASPGSVEGTDHPYGHSQHQTDGLGSPKLNWAITLLCKHFASRDGECSSPCLLLNLRCRLPPARSPSCPAQRGPQPRTWPPARRGEPS